MEVLRTALDATLSAEAAAWLATTEGALRAGDAKPLPVLFPQLARRMGKQGLVATRYTQDGYDVALDTWRACDAAGTLLLQTAQPDPGVHLHLFHHGDIEERTIALRALAMCPITQDTVDLLGEVQRTNTGFHVEAGALDSNVAVRALAAGGHKQGFTLDDLHRLVLKLAFVDLPADRLFGVFDHANPELSRMLTDFAKERQAAGRPVWPDTKRFLAAAPLDDSSVSL